MRLFRFRPLRATELLYENSNDERGLTMKPRINRRVLLVAAGSTAVAVVAGTAGAQSRDMRGALIFEGDKAIPEGQIEIYLEGPFVQDGGSLGDVKTHVKSDGGSRQIAFSLALPASATTPPTLQIVARLERDDGWLLARGSAQVETGLPVSITLHRVMY